MLLPISFAWQGWFAVIAWGLRDEKDQNVQILFKYSFWALGY